MRLILLGGGSFIARAVAACCKARNLDHVTLRHDEDVRGILRDGDRLINFTISPQYRSGPYNEAQDRDLQAAQAAAAHHAHFVMLSTRRTYVTRNQWNAHETDCADGDDTSYGRNKAVTEKAVRQVCAGQAAIFRLSNIFGYEYKSAAPRRSFLGQLLHTLKNKNQIIFDMHPDTRRDFLPVEICASMLVARTMEGVCGTYNLGSGFPVACGALAEWIMQGYGGGELVWTSQAVSDEFFLNMDGWRKRFEPTIDENALKNYCLELGRTLQCEKS